MVYIITLVIFMIRGIEFIEEISDPATSKTEMPCLPNRDQKILENIEDQSNELDLNKKFVQELYTLIHKYSQNIQS